MSEPAVKAETTLHINDQKIIVKTQVDKNFKVITYELNSKDLIDPPTTAVALYLIAKDICEKMKMSMHELIFGIEENDTAH